MTARALEHLPTGSPAWLHALVASILIVHVAVACIAIATGYGAMAAAKGSNVHRRFGFAFVASMAAMGVSAALLALLIRERGNLAAAFLVVYLVASAWITVRREPGRIGRFEYGAALVPLAVAVWMVWSGLQAAASPTGLDGYPAGPYFALALVAALLLAVDAAMLGRGGVSGSGRLARHAGRMGFAFFLAAAFFFVGRQKLMPVWMQGSPILLVLGLAPLAMTLYWLVRLRLRRRRRPSAVRA